MLIETWQFFQAEYGAKFQPHSIFYCWLMHLSIWSDRLLHFYISYSYLASYCFRSQLSLFLFFRFISSPYSRLTSSKRSTGEINSGSLRANNGISSVNLKLEIKSYFSALPLRCLPSIHPTQLALDIYYTDWIIVTRECNPVSSLSWSRIQSIGNSRLQLRQYYFCRDSL